MDIKTTHDTLFKGKLKFTQPATGFRFGIDALLLAAAVPAKAGETVLDMGCGVGAVTFCVAFRCPEVSVTGIEIQPHFAELAHRNAADNGMTDRVTILDGDITTPPDALLRPVFDHIVMNPPYMKADENNASPHKTKEIAHTEIHGDLADWIKSARRALKPKGTLSIIHRTDRIGEILHLLEKGFGAVEIIPLWPRAGEASKRVIVRAVKGNKAPLTLTAGVTVHENGQKYTADVQNCVDNAAPLAI